MPSNERDEELRIGRAKKSKAGSLRPNVRKTSFGGRGSGYAPQAIVKVAGYAHTSGQVKRMLHYVGRTQGERELADPDPEQQRELERKQNLVIEDGLGGEIQGRVKINELHGSWAEDFHRKKAGSQRQPRHAVHLVFSGKGDKNRAKDILAVKEAARAVAMKQLKGYDFALGVHQDGKYPHAHIIVKTTGLNMPKLRLGKKELRGLRRSFANELTARGLEHKAARKDPLQKKRPSNWTKKPAPSFLERTEAVLKNLQKEHRQFQRAMNRPEPCVDALGHRRIQAKVLETLRTKLTANTRITDEDLKKTLGKLNDFDRKRTKGQNMENEFEATVTKLEKDAQKLEKEYTQAHKPGREDAPEVGKIEKSKQLKKLDERNDKLQYRFSEITKQLQTSDLPTEQKKTLFKSVRQHQQGLKKFRTRERTR